MNKHTPGPWFNGQDGFSLGNGVVYSRHSNGNPKDVATIRGWGGEQQANSRLISASPDLLKALEAAVAFIDSHVADHDITKEMIATYAAYRESNPEAVILKARGEP